MSSFRFNIKQLLLLFVLLGLIGGLLSAVIGRPYRISFSAMDVGDGSQVALVGPEGLVLYDLRHGRMSKRRKLGNDLSLGTLGPEEMKFVEAGKLALLRKTVAGSYQELIYYSIADDRIDRQVALPNQNQYEQTIFFGDKMIVQRLGSGSVAFYKTETGRRFGLKLESGFESVRRVVSSDDGKLIGVIRDDGTASQVEVFDATDGRKIAAWDRKADYIKFVHNGPHLVVIDSSTVKLMNVENHETIWERALDFKVQRSQVETSPTGNRIALGHRDPKRVQVDVIEASTGKTLRTINSHNFGSSASRFVSFVDENRIAISPLNSDKGLEIFEIESGRKVTIGTFYRWTVAVLFTCLFVGWCWIWGRMAWRDEQQLSSKGNNGAEQTKSLGHALDPIDENRIDLEPTPVIEATEVGVVSVFGQKSSLQERVAWNLMAIGGVFAIAWSVIPMFFFLTNQSNMFFSQVFYLRIAVATFGLVVGLMAASRGFGRYQNWVNVTAGLQILNLINIDLINLVLGIMELALLNQNKPLKVAKLINPRLSVPD